MCSICDELQWVHKVKIGREKKRMKKKRTKKKKGRKIGRILKKMARNIII